MNTENCKGLSHRDHGVGHHHHHVILNLHLVVSMVTQLVLPLALAHRLLPKLLACFLDQHLLLTVLVVLLMAVVQFVALGGFRRL